MIEEFNRQRLDAIIEAISGMASLDFSKKAIVNHAEDSLDIISTGLNWLGEELEDSVVTKLDLEEKNKELEKFAGTLAHDLKAPVNSSSSLISLLEHNIEKGDLEEASLHIRLLKGQMTLMNNMIYGILEYSRSGMKITDVSDIDLNQFFSEIIQGLPRPENFIINIKSALPAIKAPQIRARQLFTNILSNAIKYNDKTQGTIDIEHQQSGTGYSISIKDNGPGIPSEYQERIFDPFQTLHSKSKYQSTGLGLTIVKKITDNLGGNIRVESEAGRGANFITWLPAEVQISA